MGDCGTPKAVSSILTTRKKKKSLEQSVMAIPVTPAFERQAGAGGAAVQSRPWLHNELEAILGNMRFCKKLTISLLLSHLRASFALPEF